ncbi:hypothetical protein [Sinomonas humi]|uniref:Uncharacterized protein n=1 Tax=Sinomonas humi TaxID=1338436 RepID=A0A0B2AJG6_9MICC|nr:hypothetical protein [Sinomonas humi]KHL01961.1 hypothetical protein LK10_13910 [Sinomonas humi]
MEPNGIIWAGVLGMIGVLTLSAVISGQWNQGKISHKGTVLSGNAPGLEAIPPEVAGGQTRQGARRRLIEAKDSAEKSYARRVSAAEREFNGRKNRADAHLRAAEMFLEHAQKCARGLRGEEPVEAWEGGMNDVADDFVTFARTPAPINLTTRLIESPEARRRERIRHARENLADAMLEHRFEIAAAQKLLAEVKAQDGDVVSATAALEAFETYFGELLHGVGPVAYRQDD